MVREPVVRTGRLSGPFEVSIFSKHVKPWPLPKREVILDLIATHEKDSSADPVFAAVEDYKKASLVPCSRSYALAPGFSRPSSFFSYGPSHRFSLLVL